MNKGRYLVIEGPIGVGKTSLGKLLAQELKARLVLEKADDNPFLPRFYQNPRQYAFSAQIFFLLNRYQQQLHLQQPDLFHQTTLTDYFFPKDRVFAKINLDNDEWVLYDQIYRMLELRLPSPDLVIYLQAETDVLMERIRQRGLSYEREITRDYLQRLNEAYNQFFFHYTDSPLLVIQTTDIDFVKSREDLEDLLKQIHQTRKGTQYYIPMKKTSPEGVRPR
ncbi:MAG: deoxynucleoside kinase [Nitrospirae bacterium]|nr:deoxynucleoside kinase [Nitrospirota bacterium]